MFSQIDVLRSPSSASRAVASDADGEHKYAPPESIPATGAACLTPQLCVLFFGFQNIIC